MSTSHPRTLNAPRKRVLLVDDHPLMREGVANWINRQPDLEVCGEAEDAATAVELAGKLRPDVVVADLSLRGRSGLELIKDLRAAFPRMPVLVLSMHHELFYADRAIRAGACGYIMKEAGGAKLVAAVRQVLNGEIYVGAAVSAKLLAGLARTRPRGSQSPIEQLSDREFEVFVLIGQGNDPQEIARKLHLSRKTVDVHRANIKQKLSLEHGAALVYHAVRWVENHHAELERTAAPAAARRGAPGAAPSPH